MKFNNSVKNKRKKFKKKEQDENLKGFKDSLIKMLDTVVELLPSLVLTISFYYIPHVKYKENHNALELETEKQLSQTDSGRSSDVIPGDISDEILRQSVPLFSSIYKETSIIFWR